MKHLILIFFGLTLPVTAAGQAMQPDFEFAHDAVARGEIMPLAKILAQLSRSHPGTVVEVELEYDFGTRVYEVELITADGRLIEVDLDAATGEILEVEEEDD